MPFRPGPGLPPPSLCQQGPGQEAFIFIPANNAWPGTASCRGQRARMGWKPHFLGQHSSPPDRCQEDTALAQTGAQGLLGFLSPLALTLLSLGGPDSRVLHSPCSPPRLGTRQSEVCPGSGKGNGSGVGVSGSERKQGLLRGGSGTRAQVVSC